MVMINLNDELYKEISRTIKKRNIDFPSIKNFVEKATMKELKKVQEDKEYMKKAKHLFSLVAERKFDEIEKLFPKSQNKTLSDRSSFDGIFNELKKVHGLKKFRDS